MDREQINSFSAKLDELEKLVNGGKGSGNFGHAGRPGQIGGSGKGQGGVNIIGKEATERLRKDIESWVEGKQDEHDPTALKSILKSVDDSMSRAGLNPKDSVKVWKKLVKEEKETPAFFDVKPSSKAEGLQAIVGMIKTHLANPRKVARGDGEVPYYRDAYDGLRRLSDFLGGEDDVTITSDIEGPYIQLERKEKDYGSEKSGVSSRDGHQIAREFADLSAQLSTARTNLEALQRDKGTAYDDLAGRNRYFTRSSEIARAVAYAKGLRRTKLSQETKKLVKDMETELTDLYDRYTELGTQKYFDPDLNVER